MPQRMTVAEALKQAGSELQRVFGTEGIPRAELQKRAIELCGRKAGSVIPSDFCHNRANEGVKDPPPNGAIFLWKEGARYVYVGEAYRFTGKVVRVRRRPSSD